MDRKPEEPDEKRDFVDGEGGDAEGAWDGRVSGMRWLSGGCLWAVVKIPRLRFASLGMTPGSLHNTRITILEMSEW